ncbi:Alpha-D-ribose 1-methylphosphonate 5-triphosphate diphosphatase [Thalassovita gelatinovora]|uniref:Alpha-D-ribose 1-methylphosphonate 5-triphosphate diphosphatase n=1 Tax=Thalassovita gelatinovora TaxID=53501 RepID=A0A0P1F9M3_THAGE|nr:alpha-D-ribose 1-methylphosphonate 5-triphosphate diphosphatase [Thalassovita gelatinovora]QIZ81163.1 alpha-D-ribose 1-methylphosphonate 5-triphosphate diphosphatase [Thalassovita gelatinovora]CUH64788.1 Alpha-D-ribose 1-methylphosphonate 5-triphosphate diphosphatase [Thalassovita gelatinovora]SEP92007.1 alpha-D-ribose 1-methylphosphonate 5-triphosphate diphosphatase [Thalassovita gelatinovora]
MCRILPPLRLTGATVLRDGQMQDRSVVIDQGRISKGPQPAVDLSGYYILPGIIDLHGDAFERHIAPRPSAPFPIETGLRATDREAAANGVTTAWLAQCWSWEGGMRGPDFAEDVMRALDQFRPHALTDLRLQLRYETHMIEDEDRLLGAVRRHGVDYVVFNNHLDEAVESAQNNPGLIAHWAARNGRTSKEHMDIVHRVAARHHEVPRHLCRLAEAFDTLGVSYGSHDDGSAEAREHYAMIGARICEFPTKRGPAAAAAAMGDPVLMGAPNVVRGGSQSGNIPAVQLVREGLCDALVSDYFYPALSQAAFRLTDMGTLSLPQAWALISERPAQILRLADRGVIDYGKRADLVVIHKQTRAIEATISNGRLAFLAGEAAHRFLTQPGALSMAAE